MMACFDDVITQANQYIYGAKQITGSLLSLFL